MRRAVRAAMVLVLTHASPLVAQSWNAPAALALVRRATAERATAQADSSLASYRTRAHGFVFFLAQGGEGLREPPAGRRSRSSFRSGPTAAGSKSTISW